MSRHPGDRALAVRGASSSLLVMLEFAMIAMAIVRADAGCRAPLHLGGKGWDVLLFAVV